MIFLIVSWFLVCIGMGLIVVLFNMIRIIIIIYGDLILIIIGLYFIRAPQGIDLGINRGKG